MCLLFVNFINHFFIFFLKKPGSIDHRLNCSYLLSLLNLRAFFFLLFFLLTGFFQHGSPSLSCFLNFVSRTKYFSLLFFLFFTFRPEHPGNQVRVVISDDVMRASTPIRQALQQLFTDFHHAYHTKVLACWILRSHATDSRRITHSTKRCENAIGPETNTKK